MFTYITLALATVASVSGLVIPRGKPATYGNWLEDYDTYHTRYLAIGCKGQQGTEFFNLCCRPMLATEVLEKARPAQCIPGAASSAANPSKTVSATPSPSATEDPEEGWCYEGDEGCDCEDEPESSSAAPAPSSTSAPAETPSPRPDITLKPTSPKPTPTPKPTTSPKPTSTPAPAPNGQVVSGGSATFFYQNGVAGACGIVHKDTDFVAALPGAMYGDYSKQSDKCGKKIRVTRPSNGKSVDVIIADACPSCPKRGDVDLSKAAFLQLATEEEGMVPVTYQFI
jgi:hypothetical protein